MEKLAKETPQPKPAKAKTEKAPRAETPIPTMDDAGDDDAFFQSLID